MGASLVYEIIRGIGRSALKIFLVLSLAVAGAAGVLWFSGDRESVATEAEDWKTEIGNDPLNDEPVAIASRMFDQNGKTLLVSLRCQAYTKVTFSLRTWNTDDERIALVESRLVPNDGDTDLVNRPGFDMRINGDQAFLRFSDAVTRPNEISFSANLDINDENWSKDQREVVRGALNADRLVFKIPLMLQGAVVFDLDQRSGKLREFIRQYCTEKEQGEEDFIS